MTPRPELFPFVEYWWFYAGFTAFVCVLLAVDLGVFHRSAHKVSFREAGMWAGIWVSLALLFNAGFYFYMRYRFAHDPRLQIPGFDVDAVSMQTALEFLAGYVVEYSLSVDNIFVFVVVLNYFGVPSRYQHRVLFFGILGALIFRAIFIALGALLLRFEPVIWLFGGFLVYTGFRMMFTGDEGVVDPSERAVIRWVRRHIPVTPDFRGQSFFVKEAGRLHATPLFIALLFLEMTDIVFAVDSVPAIFGLTREPLVVFTSNIFAILGLRNLYFLLAGAVDKFHMLKYGLGIVLIFLGLKMTLLNRLFGGHFPIAWSLGIIVGVIGISIALSLLFPKASEESSKP